MYDCIPPIKSSLDNCSQITPYIAEYFGLNEKVIVSGGLFDIDACALSVGIKRRRRHLRN